MGAFVTLGQWLFGRLPFCSLVGALVGVTAGSLLGLTLDSFPPQGLPPAAVIAAGLMLGGFGWIVVIIFMGVWMRYGVGQIWAPAAVNAALTGVLTVLINLLVRQAVLAPALGIVIGILVGAILCRFCPPVRPSGSDK